MSSHSLHRRLAASFSVGTDSSHPASAWRAHLFHPITLLLGLALGLLPPALQAAPQQWLDATIAIVENDVILASQLDSRINQVMANLRAKGGTPPPRDQLYRQVLEQLILESLQLQMADRASIRIDDNSLNQTIETIAKQNGMDLDALQKTLEAEGTPFPAFRERIRREMRISRLRQGIVGSNVRISDQEVMEFLSSQEGKSQLSTEYHLAHILIALPEGALPPVAEEAKKQADEIAAQIKNGTSFDQLALTNSNESTALEGGDLGWRREAELPSLFSGLVSTMQVGEAKGPIRSPSGYHFIKLLDKRGELVKQVTQVHVNHILIAPNEIRDQQQSEQLANEILQRLQRGEKFAELARTYSDDPGSSLAGGDLGWSDPERFAPEFQDAIKTLPDGVTSKPFRTRFGWHIARVEGRRSADISREYQMSQVRELLFRRKFDEELTNWLRKIRDEAYVEFLQ